MANEPENRPVDLNQLADRLFDYLRGILYDPDRAHLEVETLPPEFVGFGMGLRFFAKCVCEARAFANALSKGTLAVDLPSPGNEMASGLKSLHSSLKHLTWQTQQVANGDYTQRVEFMGEFSAAFNNMVEKLEKRRVALVAARHEAENANKAKSAYLATISHEVRTPLNAIIGLSEIQLRSNAFSGSRVNLEKIRNAGMALLEMVNDLLDMSRLEANGLELVPTAYQTPGLINDAAQMNIVRIGSKRIDFILEVEETLPAVLHGDDLRIAQILNNLLSNAIKYTREGRVTLRVDWEWASEDDAWLIFRVADTGVGIRKEDLGKLFAEYHRFDAGVNRAVEGTGLGMSITKRLVEMMGGDISVESEYGRGSVFTARVLQRLPDYVPIGVIEAENLTGLRSNYSRNTSIRVRKIDRKPMPGKRVLVVDDDSINLVVAKGLLAPYELGIECVKSGKEAIGRVGSPEGRYDAIFMDHMMPEMDGVETVRVIRNGIAGDHARSVPIVALTADNSAGARELFLANGFNDFLSKPIDIAQLDGILNKWVRGQASEHGAP